MILITGATGELGGAVARKLKSRLNKNIGVLIRDDQTDKAKALKKDGLDLRIGDYADKESLLNAFTGVETLYFVSGSDIAKRNPQHKNVVEAAVATGITHVVYTSVSLNHLTQDSALYLAMKDHLDTEKWLEESGLDYTFLRHNLYMDLLPFFIGQKEQLLQSKAVFLPTQHGKTNFVLREELAEVGTIILENFTEHQNKIYELNGSNSIDFEEITEIVGHLLGVKLSYQSPTAPNYEETLKGNGVPPEVIGVLSSFSQGIADNLFHAQTNHMEELLGRPTTGVSTFLESIYK